MLGYKGGPYDAAYNFHPYILVDQSEKNIWKLNGIHEDELLSRFLIRSTGLMVNRGYVVIMMPLSENKWIVYRDA